MAARKKAPARKRKSPQASRRSNETQAIPGWIWMVLGIAMGLGLAIFLLTAGMLPRGERTVTEEREGVPTPRVDTGRDTSELVDEPARDSSQVDYDFYTILPEMDVVVPETEMSERVERAQQNDGDDGPYLIQVGSFKKFEDADRIKAELAFLGIQASIVTVAINNEEYHRVRVGPYSGARATEEAKLQLRNNGYQTLVLKERS